MIREHAPTQATSEDSPKWGERVDGSDARGVSQHAVTLAGPAASADTRPAPDPSVPPADKPQSRDVRGAPGPVTSRAVATREQGFLNCGDCATRPHARGLCQSHYDLVRRHQGLQPITVEDRFWAKVAKTDGCWLWTGACGSQGHGQLYLDGRLRQAHRVSWTVIHRLGPIPYGMQLDHLCRVRNCVRPQHLEVVTPRENCLRGESPAAQHARKTHCPQGHPYDEANTYRPRHRRGRQCRTCNRLRAAARRTRTEVAA